MFKTGHSRFLALLGTSAVTASLIGVAVVGTGSYFTDSKPGSVEANFGNVAVAVAGENINFVDLMPGEVQTQTVTVHNQGTGLQDIWLAFDNVNFAWSAVNDLGQYGKFVINGKTYDNLNNKYDSTTGVAGTPIDGSFMGGSCSTVNRVPVNYLPSRILLGTLASDQIWTFNISFNIIACKSDGGGGDLWSSVADDFTSPGLTGPLPLNFNIAAFQSGILPSNEFNGAGAIPDLVLPIGMYLPGIYQ